MGVAEVLLKTGAFCLAGKGPVCIRACFDFRWERAGPEAGCAVDSKAGVTGTSEVVGGATGTLEVGGGAVVMAGLRV